jgi:hypothetical protein
MGNWGLIFRLHGKAGRSASKPADSEHDRLLLVYQQFIVCAIYRLLE